MNRISEHAGTRLLAMRSSQSRPRPLLRRHCARCSVRRVGKSLPARAALSIASVSECVGWATSLPTRGVQQLPCPDQLRAVDNKLPTLPSSSVRYRLRTTTGSAYGP